MSSIKVTSWHINSIGIILVILKMICSDFFLIFKLVCFASRLYVDHIKHIFCLFVFRLISIHCISPGLSSNLISLSGFSFNFSSSYLQPIYIYYNHYSTSTFTLIIFVGVYSGFLNRFSIQSL